MSDVDYTLEPHQNGFVLYEHGEYGQGSVLEGQYRKTYIRSYDTIEKALEDNPDLDIDIRDHPTMKPELILPDTPPDWFDPGYAGEEW